MFDSDKIYVNGIDATTGEYLIKPVDYGDLATLLVETESIGDSSQEPGGEPPLSWLRQVYYHSKPHAGLPEGVNPANVKRAGWGIVFAEGEDPAVKDAFAPLIAHRRQQVGDKRVKVLEYKSSESRAAWLARYGVAAGSIDPTIVPYYLLLVGSPTKIPFSFAHRLDVEYGVGVLQLDTPEDYGQYVESLISYEREKAVPTAKEAVFFATTHPGDGATRLSTEHLVKPLAAGRGRGRRVLGIAEAQRFRQRAMVGSAATKAALKETLSAGGGQSPPALLFTASHGMGFPKGHPDQLAAQGALLCQDWPGSGPAGPEHYFAAGDVADDANVYGSVMFCFACFGAGTPSYDRFMHELGGQPSPLADAPFFSALPKRLLSHPRGGALAFIGHVERAWAYSIGTRDAGPQLLPFENAIKRILKGQPLGYAMKDFNERYAALSTDLSDTLERVSAGEFVAGQDLASLWIERNDAEGYVVMGDPAVRLRVGDMG